jgi:hypothetical protein
VVDDSQQGLYFKVSMPSSPRGLIDLNARKPERMRVKQAGLAVDLEAITLLADGRVAMLSERLRSLVTEDGIVAEYDSTFAEIAKRGLEGVASRPLNNQASRVAVVWEGGYPDLLSLPEMMKGRAGGRALRPVVLIHDIPKNGKVGRVQRSTVPSFQLDVPQPAGQEPRAQRFRAPDLVWTRLEPKGEWGVMVLLSGQNGAPPIRYSYHWLQRFDLQGKRVGAPLDLRPMLPEHVRESNWEGLCWWEEGQTLMMVNEADEKVGAHAFLIDLPTEWRFGKPSGSARQ